MKHIRFKFKVDDDVKEKYDIRQPCQIEFYITTYLNHPDGWGHLFEPVSHNENVLIRLCSSSTIKDTCGVPRSLSCAELGGKYMYLNAERWFHGASASNLDLDSYRMYMVSHEMGHILGYDHEKCPCKGCDAPIMMQQTLGIGECKPNTKV